MGGTYQTYTVALVSIFLAAQDRFAKNSYQMLNFHFTFRKKLKFVYGAYIISTRRGKCVKKSKIKCHYSLAVQ